MPNWQVLTGDCREVLKPIPDNSIDALCTDPQYGLSEEPDIAEVLGHWLAGTVYEHNKPGFMAAKWDSFVPGPDYWREIFRVLKPGGHALVFTSTRTWDLLSIAMRFAGFENRDTIAHFGVPARAWIYGQGFPHGLNVERAIAMQTCVQTGRHFAHDYSLPKEDKRLPDDHVCPMNEESEPWEGWNTALKPSFEIVMCMRKPLAIKTIAENVRDYGTGALNIDATRVGWDAKALASDTARRQTPRTDITSGRAAARAASGSEPGAYEGNAESPAGRWPPNVTFQHLSGCRSKGVTEPVEEWECQPDCPVGNLAAQSGISTSLGGRSGHEAAYGGGYKREFYGDQKPGYGDEGSAARYFPQFDSEPAPGWEVVLVMRKPLAERSVAENVRVYGVGAINVDATRIACDWQAERGETWLRSGKQLVPDGQWQGPSAKPEGSTVADRVSSAGRWPANAVFQHHPECKLLGTKTVKAADNNGTISKPAVRALNPDGWAGVPAFDYADADGNEVVEAWSCHPECEVAALAAQSGISHAGGAPDRRLRAKKVNVYGEMSDVCPPGGQGPSEGDATRFFESFQSDPADLDVPFRYFSKASPSEREAGLEGMEPIKRDATRNADQPSMNGGEGNPYNRGAKPVLNSHPTVKPVNLCRWLARLCCPPGGTILDPFAGSGSIGIAAILEGFNYVGIELDDHYSDIARRRLTWAEKHPEDYAPRKQKGARKTKSVVQQAEPAPVVAKPPVVQKPKPVRKSRANDQLSLSW